MPDPNSGGMLVGASGIVMATAALLKQWRDGRRQDHVDPVALVTDANKAAYMALQGTIETLQVQVAALTRKLDATESALHVTNLRLAEVQADLLITKTENRQLRSKVSDLTRVLSGYGHST